jgi:tRNA(Ile)-lysidine synthase
VAHFNHKLRGAESDEDEKFVAEVAAEYGIPFHRGEKRVAEAPGNLEEAARRARQNFFEQLIQDGAGNRIATGHTLDDQAETVLFRMLRGAGPAGMAGILPVTPQGLIRPLLGVTRAEVEQHLHSRGIGWREDSSNRDLRFARNRIRHGLLPELAREWNPRIAQVLARAAEVAWAEEIWWATEVRRLAEELLLEVEGGVEAEAAKIASLPKALARRLIRHIAASGACGAGLDFEHVERVLELTAEERGEGEVDLPGLRVLRSFAWVRFETAPGRSRLGTEESRLCSVPGRHRWGNGYVCLEVAGTDQRRGDCVSLKLRSISELSPSELAPLELRSWRAGDRYRPARGSREYTIQELFQRARVPSWRRHVWPVICMGPKILWVRQFGAAAEFAAPDEGAALRIWEETECPVR